MQCCNENALQIGTNGENSYRNTSPISRATIMWITEVYILAHLIVPRTCMETMVTQYHLQFTDRWYPPRICKSVRNRGWVTYRCNIFTFTNPDSPCSRATITCRWRIMALAKTTFINGSFFFYRQKVRKEGYNSPISPRWTRQYWHIYILDLLLGNLSLLLTSHRPTNHITNNNIILACEPYHIPIEE